MKKLMLVAAVVIASVSAHASKARLEALQNAAHLSDIRQAFDRKAEETVNYEAGIIEFGGANETPNAEGGFIRKMGDNALGFYLGKPSLTYQAQAGAIATGIGSNADEDTLLLDGVSQRNPIIVTFGSKVGGMAWGVGAFYATSDFKSYSETSGAEILSGKLEQNIAGVYGGVNNGTFDAQLRVGLMGETKFSADAANTVAALGTTGNLKGTSTMNVKASGGINVDTMYFFGSAEMLGGEAKLTGTKVADTENQNIEVGVINSHKKDGIDFFYGARYVMETYENKKAVGPAIKKTETNSLPILVGIEGEASSWLTLRAAISQNFPFLSTTKSKTAVASGKTNTSEANTTTTLGAGIKWGKATIDTVLGMGSTGQFGFDSGSEGDGTLSGDTRTGNFVRSSLTYNF